MTEFDPGDYDVTITRAFDAPRELVWEAWTDPERVAQWWGPEGFTVPRCEMDVRPGGAFRIDMEAPDGTVYPSDGTFEAVEELERLVLVAGAVEGEGEDGSYLMEVRQTVTFEDRNGRTELTLVAEVVSATPDVTEHLDGMEEGWDQSLTKLAGHVEPESGNDEADVETTGTSLTVRRTFDAPRERVFRAFTDPEELAEWYAPGDMTAQVHAWEASVGGTLSVSMLDDDGSHDAEGTFTEVAEDERLVHTWTWTHLPDSVESSVTVEFRDVDGGTEVVLIHEELPSQEAVEDHVKGWTGIIENLGAALGGA